MGRKIRAAKASLVAAFVAASGAAAAKAIPGHSAKPAATAAEFIKWGDPLIRFLKLDGFPSYLKIDGFAQLAQFYKEALLTDAAALYLKDATPVADVLDMYQKANAGPLSGILIGLEQFYKEKNSDALFEYIKSEEGMANYLKFERFFSALQRDAPDAFQFFYKETGIAGNPLEQIPTDSGGQIG
jgi:hypothetical protein